MTRQQDCCEAKVCVIHTQQKLSQPEKIWSLLKVEVALFRDLDSRASSREVAAVQEWLQSKHVFHVMRDHPGHDMPILAGMWGVKLSSPQMRKALQAVFYQMLHADSAYWRGQIISSRDQALLERYLWPWAKDITLQHDSYHCDLFAKSHPWPTRRQESGTNNYVGAPFALNTTLSTTCPVKCRPRTHPEWNLCWKYYSLHKPANRDWCHATAALEGKTNLLKGNLWPNSPQCVFIPTIIPDPTATL